MAIKTGTLMGQPKKVKGYNKKDGTKVKGYTRWVRDGNYGFEFYGNGTMMINTTTYSLEDAKILKKNELDREAKSMGMKVRIVKLK